MVCGSRQLKLFQLFLLLLAPLLARCQTPQEQNLQNSVNSASFHADLPFLGDSHKKRWYLYLVISVVGAAFLMSLTVVIFGFVKWSQRRRILAKRAEATGDEEAVAKRTDVYGNLHEKELKAPVRLELLAFKPTKEDDLRVRVVCKDNEAALQRERMRRTAQHENPLQKLHTLRRLNSS
ncbi:hypothetical protein COCSUDRAFT_54418 [Coccomyxa subellipsoidea C-169]|uniref:Uncharacterized protein n=1 Tax=Coccomyxa subellipsoidea (strain C-169) TaxID=574566 RepID=I0YP52_COCSC|nr:hypothetical protein COCSUDRAFT_54418 [Coccomyxa subellipsoidea C-169]EIE20171.1 hypothetical protein COCSUDRAFT_54418 [Coccomyxa subellipsoidea C-169]|eukprot:XP_005644715.1 hypothetical protein COCSUDRAFT_54418 [Coccomyxa subellipsoidea C-169]